MKRIKSSLLLFCCMLTLFNACKKPLASPTEYTLVQPRKFPIFEDDVEKNITVEGIELGRHLFYDPILSGDSSISCSTCHVQQDGFSDKRRFSVGIDGSIGNLQSMPLINLVWAKDFFWNGRSKSLEEQALEPVENPIEMKAHWPIVVEKLKRRPLYQELFELAFPEEEITKELAADAISQFEKTLISSSTWIDKEDRGEYNFTEQEFRGAIIFTTERGDCFHCHGNVLATDLDFHNNGLDSNPDPGLEAVTGRASDRGRFKTPSLRNIALTAPYMHDGRFNTLDEVIDFYSSGLKDSPTIDENMKQISNQGIQLSAEEKADLKAFLLLYSDKDFTTNPAFANPF